FGNLRNHRGGARAPLPMRLGGGDVELPDGSDAAAREQLQRQVFGRGSAEGHHRLSPWHSAGVAVPQGRSLNLVAWPLQAEHQRRYALEECAPQREQNGESLGMTMCMAGTITRP